MYYNIYYFKLAIFFTVFGHFNSYLINIYSIFFLFFSPLVIVILFKLVWFHLVDKAFLSFSSNIFYFSLISVNTNNFDSFS